MTWDNKKTALYSLGMAILMLLIIPLTDISDGGESRSNAVSNNYILEQDQTANVVSNVNHDIDQGGGEILTEEQSVNTDNNPSVNGDSISSLLSIERVLEVPRTRCDSRSCLVHSLDDDVPLFYENTQADHQLASVTKLLTAVIAYENLDPKEEILISDFAVNNAESLAGNLQPGEVYYAEDLIKIMLMTSSNSASIAFEEHFGNDYFLAIINEKAWSIGMVGSNFEDGSGLSNFNTGTARDILNLVKYINDYHPKILQWTAIEEEAFYTVDFSRLNILKNIVPFVASRENYIYGKTGTTSVAGQNIVAVFNISNISGDNQDIVFILFNSPDRYEELDRLVDWVVRAYNW